ncbi:hypothetical protein HOY82DRAFT_607500 [Tuber indicum]|nr:hypothetical protein HOY82DRAFT_607500 [Tuber indicum]
MDRYGSGGSKKGGGSTEGKGSVEQNWSVFVRSVFLFYGGGSDKAGGSSKATQELFVAPTLRVPKVRSVKSWRHDRTGQS